MTVHVAGAGLAGLAAAVGAARAGHRVVVHEAAAQAGGRCRSYLDGTLGREIDNGTHVILGANEAAFAYLEDIGAGDSFGPAAGAALPFADLAGGGTWALDLDGRGVGPLVGAAGGASRRIALLLRFASRMAVPGATVASAFAEVGPAYGRVIEPTAVAIMNRPAAETRLRDIWGILRALVRGGPGAMRPFMARPGLARALIEPALGVIARLGGEVRFYDPLLSLEAAAGGRIRAAVFRSGRAAFDAGDALMVALPPWALSFLPDGIGPGPAATRAILCTHFAIDNAAGRLPEGARLMGVTGGLAQWLAVSEGVLSVTVSAADSWMERDAEEIAGRLWREVCAALALGDAPRPPCRVIKERRATAEVSGGFGPASPYANLFFAGGWTLKRYPDTIEAALASGARAAKCLGGAA